MLERCHMGKTHSFAICANYAMESDVQNRWYNPSIKCSFYLRQGLDRAAILKHTALNLFSFEKESTEDFIVFVMYSLQISKQSLWKQTDS